MTSPIFIQRNTKVMDGVLVMPEYDPSTLEHPNPEEDIAFLYCTDDGNGNTVLKLKRSDGTSIGFIKTNPDSISFNTDAIAGDYLKGTLRWNDTDKCLEFDTGIDEVTIQIGQEVVLRARNSTGSIINNGSVVRVNGATGNRPTVTLAQANTVANAMGIIGMATQDIDNNSDGFITIIGTVRGLNTNDFDEGDILYLSDSVAGGLTSAAPNIPIEIGVMTRGHVTQGTIDVHVNSHLEVYTLASNPSNLPAFSKSAWLNDLSAAEIVSPPVSATSTGAAGQIAYDASYFYICTATNTWKRVAIAGW